jgi:hypothetical protein
MSVETKLRKSGKVATDRETERLPWQRKAGVAPSGCEGDKKKSGDSHLAGLSQKSEVALPERLVMRAFPQRLEIALPWRLVTRALTQ